MFCKGLLYVTIVVPRKYVIFICMQGITHPQPSNITVSHREELMETILMGNETVAEHLPLTDLLEVSSLQMHLFSAPNEYPGRQFAACCPLRKYFILFQMKV